MISRACWLMRRGHDWAPIMTLQYVKFLYKFNGLGRLSGGVKVARHFKHQSIEAEQSLVIGNLRLRLSLPEHG